MEKLVDIELARRLKSEGYRKPCNYYYQDIDLPFSSRGLKHSKEEMNHNGYDGFIYSAPTFIDGIDWLAGKKIIYPSSIVIKLGKRTIQD
jgi:hypothetical protein